jgi:hypothetical protein
VNRADVVKLLTLAATYDLRKLGEADVEAWFLAVDDLVLEDAQEAVVAYYREHTERIMPAHVRQGVRALRAARRRQEPHPIRSLPSPFEKDDMGRQVQIARGAATVREIVGPVLARIAEKSAGQSGAVSALEQLRQITAGPDWTDPDAASDGEVVP